MRTAGWDLEISKCVIKGYICTTLEEGLLLHRRRRSQLSLNEIRYAVRHHTSLVHWYLDKEIYGIYGMMCSCVNDNIQLLCAQISKYIENRQRYSETFIAYHTFYDLCFMMF